MKNLLQAHHDLLLAEVRKDYDKLEAQALTHAWKHRSTRVMDGGAIFAGPLFSPTFDFSAPAPAEEETR